MAETDNLQSIKTVGIALEDFASIGLLDHLTKIVCDPCPESPDGCNGCYGMVVLSHIEDQIGEIGIEIMKQLVKEWRDEA